MTSKGIDINLSKDETYYYVNCSGFKLEDEEQTKTIIMYLRAVKRYNEKVAEGSRIRLIGLAKNARKVVKGSKEFIPFDSGILQKILKVTYVVDMSMYTKIIPKDTYNQGYSLLKSKIPHADIPVELKEYFKIIMKFAEEHRYSLPDVDLVDAAKFFGCDVVKPKLKMSTESVVLKYPLLKQLIIKVTRNSEEEADLLAHYINLENNKER